MQLQVRNCAFLSSFLITSLSQQVAARFTLNTCWYEDCVVRTAAGSMCFVPKDVFITPCTGTGHGNLATAFETHMKQDLSIAYYDGLDNVRLGGVDFNVPSDGSIVRLCLSGRAVGGGYSTLCLNAVGDNVLFEDSSAYCKQRLAPAAVSDGCYHDSITAGNSTSTGTTSTSTSIRKNSAVSERGSTDFFLFLFFFIHFPTYLI